MMVDVGSDASPAVCRVRAVRHATPRYPLRHLPPSHHHHHPPSPLPPQSRNKHTHIQGEGADLLLPGKLAVPEPEVLVGSEM